MRSKPAGGLMFAPGELSNLRVILEKDYLPKAEAELTVAATDSRSHRDR